MKIAKKIFFIILIILIVLFSTYVVYEAATKVCGLENCEGNDHSIYQNYTDESKFITSLNPDNWTLGKTMGLGLTDVESYTSWKDEKGKTWIVHKGKFLEGFLMRGNKYFYCIEPGQDLSTGEYQYVAKIVIDENNVYLTKKDVAETIKGNETGIARHSTRELLEILKRAKVAASSMATYTDRDGAHKNVGTQYLRERGENHKNNDFIIQDFSFKYDVYQNVVWKHLSGWRNTVFGSSELLEIGTGDNSNIDSNRGDADLLYAVEYEADKILESVYADINDESIRETGVIITDNSSTDIKSKELSTSQKYGDYTIFGPFKYDYKGNIGINIYFNNNTSNSNAAVTIGTWSGSAFTEVSTIPDNKDFYIKVPTNYLTASIKTLNVDVEVSSTEETTTLYILESVNKTYQNAMYVKQTSTPISDSAQFSYKLEKVKTVTLEKKTTDGQKLPNVTFKLYDENGTYKNTYTTDGNGKIIIPNLEIGKKYIVEETLNTIYGGRGANIASATISAGGTISNIDKENRKITFKLTDNATLTIANTINLGKITIRKIDNTSGKEIKLQGVEFALWDMTVGWVSLYDKNTGKFIDKIDKENEINILDYVVKASDANTAPTKFVTNSNGEIVINSLQINYSINAKNHFLVSEVTNNRYGYKGMILESGNIVMSDDNTRITKEGSAEIQNGSLVKFDNTGSCIRQKDKSVKFSIDSNTILTIKNKPKLGDLQIIKTGEEAKPLSNVKFAVWQEEKAGFIRLTDTEFKNEIGNTKDIDLLNYKINYTSNINEATKFVTNSEGIINITNFEVYSGVDSEGNAIPNVYVVREVENKNYGYKATILGENTVTINEKPIGENNLSSSIDETKKEIKFTMQGDTKINIGNIPKFSNLTIEKIGKDGEKQQDVEFILWQLAGGYVRLFEKNGVDFKETIDSKNGEPIDLKNYIIRYTSSATGDEEPTRFITNELGQIQINNIEIYHRAGGENHHFISEVKNNNYGYEERIIEDATIVGGELKNFDDTESYIRQSDSSVKFTVNENTVLTIKNKPQFGNILIKKESIEGKVLPNVEFELWQLAGGYVRLFTEVKDEEGETRLKFVDIVKSENDKPIDFKNYVIEHVLEVTDNQVPTRFITNELGQIQINNLKTYHGTKQNYHFISEVENNNYGYRGMIIEDVTIVDGELTNFDNTESYIRQRDRAVKFAITENTTLTIKNIPQLGSVMINKESTNGEVLPNVEFIITRGENEYVVLKDSEGNSLNPNEIDSEAIIDIDKQFENNEYLITYSTDKDKATVFITGKEGTINVENLEVYQPYVISRPRPVVSEEDKNTEVVDTQPVSYTYTIQEISNPNYGYAIVNRENVIVTIDSLTAGEFKEITVENESATRNLEILKKDDDAENIKLSNVGFAIYTTTEGSSKKGYLSVYDENNKFQEKIGKEITINEGYRLEYKYFYDEYEKLEDNQQSEITIFETNAEGKINIKNLEVYERETGKTYQYKVEEIYNENFGYEINYETMETIVLKKQNKEESDTKSETIFNEQVYAKLSGYVWEEYADPKKTSPTDLLYTESTKDIKLTDLYIWNKNKGIYEQNPNAEIPVKILLRDTNTNQTREPDEFIYKANGSTEKIQDAGKYTFKVEIAKLANYEIVFEYDGFYYSTVIPNTQVNNGSKAVENESKRTELNQKFGTVESGDKIVSSDGKSENGVIYDEIKEQKSELLGFVDTDLTKIQAGTIINLSKIFEDAKENSEVPVEGIDNINVGLVRREQPILWVTSNIDNLEVNLKVDGDEHKYIYDYKDGERQYLNEEYYFDEKSGEYKKISAEEKSLTDKFKKENEISTLKQTIVKSDLQAVEKNNQIEMDVSMIYKISLNNASGKLTSVIHEIKNYFDPRLSIEEIGLSINNNQIEDIIYKANSEEGLVNISIEENVTAEYGDGIEETTRSEYTPARIPLGTNGIRLESLKTRNIYIKYKMSLSGRTLEEILSGEAVYYNNAAEIIKYSSYYENSLGKGKIKITNNGKTQEFDGDIITENQNSSRTGQIYAGINQGSRPDNLKLKLIKNEENTALIFDTSEFEFDSTAAQSLVIVAEGVRTISGTVFEDYATVVDNKKNGDGKFDSNVDSLISNVKVELYNVTEKGAIISRATYANGEPIVTEAINGKYTLGEYIEEDGTTYGILPGKYRILYTYGLYKDENNKEKQTYVANPGIKRINMMDYKSTIIPEESSLQKEFKNNIDGNEVDKTWFTLQGGQNYSTAIDNLQLRPEYSEPVSSITFGKIKGTGITITSQNGIVQRQTIGCNVMTAQTLPMDVNIQFTKEKGRKVVIKGENGEIKYNELEEKLENVNFGIVERPNIDIKIDKKITNLEVVAQNGASIIPKGNPQESKMDYITAPKNEDTITAQVDTKLLHGATLNLEYTVTVENKSNIDYICKEYYYFGEENKEFENTPTAKLIVDYLDATMELDESKHANGVWKKETADALRDNEYIDPNVYLGLTSNKNNEQYYVYTTSAFKDVKIGDAPKEEKMYVSKKLSISEDITEVNRVEIIEIAGRRAITGAIPGNYNPTELLGTSGNSSNKNYDNLNDPVIRESSSTILGNYNPTSLLGTSGNSSNKNYDDLNESVIRESSGAIQGNYNPTALLGISGNTSDKNYDYLSEPDWSKYNFRIIPPTGTTVDYKMYTIATVVMLTILTIGIIVVKKKVII